MKVLGQIHVHENIDPDKLENFIGAVLLKDQVAFADDEIPTEGRGHNKALHITVKHKQTYIARVLIDNGSALNICPLATLNHLGIDLAEMQSAKTSVKSFDGMKKNVMGQINIEIQIGPSLFDVLFRVLDIPSAFNLLLRFPWIHNAGAVPSSLHQKIKFVVKRKLVIIHGEEDHRIFNETVIPYIEPAHNEEDSYHAFELVQTIHASPESPLPVPEMSTASLMVAKVMIGNGFEPDKGLGIVFPNSPKGQDLCAEVMNPDDNEIDVGVLDLVGWFDELTIAAVFEDPIQVHGALEKEPYMVPRPPRPSVNAIFDDLLEGLDSKGKYEEGNPMDLEIYDLDESSPDYEEIRRDFERHEEAKPLTGEESISINLGDAENPREVKIEANLPKDVAERLTKLLRDYRDIFAWSYADMPGLDRSIVEHYLLTDPSIEPIKQRTQRAKPELAQKIKEEVIKLLDVGFIETTECSDRIANIVPLLKKDGRVRVYGDYRDLNKASPKDDFPLPHIDVVVDDATGFEQFSFMDGFSRYNQIPMNINDKLKSTFTTPWGLFHYKTRHGEDRVETLTKLFERLRKFKLRLNPAKCIFGTSSGKLLGFIVSSRGIEIDPSKVKAICELKLPTMVKEVRGLMGRLNYIA
ncbi:uncharacterized protein LOC125314640 [Rhodamnia argentea]|uniref:Uncharacterized protein LOC125314640 n=1 Tax=Rhodamnia argentea TaxID=178133 RepID=A0ABM3H9Z2_9MYRT|nr:uncharacterized protein LOC125314640 [Rhodamnia argentea]